MKKICVLFLVIFFASFSYAEGKYDFVMVSSGSSGNWGTIRYDTETGRSWVVRAGIFVELLEKVIPPKGDYKISMVQTKKSWGATRLDVNTGKGWYLKESMWIPILESSNN